MKTNILRLPMFFIAGFYLLISCEADEDTVTNFDSEDTAVATDSGEDFEEGETIAMSSLTTEMITDWLDLWLELDRYATGMRPNATARALAYINLAAYETAVQDFNGLTSNEGRFNQLDINQNQREENVDLQIALNTCYAEVINHFMLNLPNEQRNMIRQLEGQHNNTFRDTFNESVIGNSRRWGNHIADRVIEFSRSDRRAEEQIQDPQPLSYETEVGDGHWTYSAEEERVLFPYWGKVRTFVIGPDETSTIAPIPYSENPESNYFGQMLEVYDVNNEARETNGEQLWIAEFWSDDLEGLMMSPPGRQLSIATQLIRKFDMVPEEALTLLLRLGFVLNDAAVSTWDDKYEYLVMRPSNYIHEFIDEEYQTNLFRLIFWPNPTFPGYPSGHSAFASAAAGVFIHQFGDTVDFTDRSHEGRTEFRGNPRQFGSFSEMAEENAYSRIPLGVHIRMDCDEGLRSGYEIADAVNQFELSQ